MIRFLMLFAAVACVASAIYEWLGAILVAWWMREPPATTNYGALPPVTLLRPIKPGVPNLVAKLERLAQSMRPGDQLVLGAAAGSAELAACETLRADFPGREIVVVPCRDGVALNPKISKLAQMDPHCWHERLIVSDSETIIDPAWLDALRSEWAASGAEVLTTGYRFVGTRTWPQRFDAAAALLSLWPGIALVRQWGRVRFALGVCTALRRGDLEAAGGWRAFGDFLAEDRQLGAALAARGGRIHFAQAVATLDADPLTWRDWWRHQRRVAVTYRVSAPWGFAGMALTHGTTAALALACLTAAGPSRRWGLTLAAASFAARWLAAKQIAHFVRFPAPALGLSMLVAGLVETAAWILSWLPAKTWWSGRFWRVSADGKLRPLPRDPISR